jgi:hypothetical protein
MLNPFKSLTKTLLNPASLIQLQRAHAAAISTQSFFENCTNQKKQLLKPNRNFQIIQAQSYAAKKSKGK